MHLIVVGAGQAAAELVTALRQHQFAGRITIVGDEPHLPYQRPPLSKDFLNGKVQREALSLRAPAAYEKASIELQLGTRVAEIDRARKHVQLQDGTSLPYDKLALCLGGRARRLSLGTAGDLGRFENCHYLRTIDDVERLRGHFAPGAKLVIVGGGYIGLEVAAVAVQSGLNVCVLEAAPNVLARVTAPEIARWYESLHRGRGVEIRTGVRIVDVRTSSCGRRVTHIVCADDVVVPVDVVLAGVGLTPNTELASAAGLEVDNGIVVDACARTSDPDIVAAGDCTSQFSQLYDRHTRIESVPNAVEQARTAATVLCGQARANVAVPWFWSDQFGIKLQIAGLSQGYDDLVVRGSLADTSFAAFYLQQGRVIAADTAGRAPEFMIAKKLVAQRSSVDRKRLADPSLPIRELLEA